MPMITTTTAAWRLGPDYPSKKVTSQEITFPRRRRCSSAGETPIHTPSTLNA